MKKTGHQNPQPGDLLKETVGPSYQVHWIVSDFIPWGLDGKHAWVIQNPLNGRKKVVLKVEMLKMEVEK